MLAYSQAARQGIGWGWKGSLESGLGPLSRVSAKAEEACFPPTAQSTLPPLCWPLDHTTTCNLGSAPGTSQTPNCPAFPHHPLPETAVL